MKKFLFSVMLIVLMLGATVAKAQPLNTNDSIRVHSFLIQSSAVAGISNGQQLNIDFDANNPATWSGFSISTNWILDSENNEMRLSIVNIANRSLAGVLNLNGCDSLVYVACQQNSISSLSLNDATKLDVLYCNDNQLSFLNIHNSNSLRIFEAANNNLSFTTLMMPNSYSSINKTDWNVGLQKEFKPDDVIRAGNNYYCEGMVVDFSTLRGATFEWIIPPNIPLLPTTDYIRSSNDVFTFNDINEERVVRCTIRNASTHWDMQMITVPFQLLFLYNANDVAKLRYFLEQPSLEASIKNGTKVTSYYNIDVPRTFGVKWVVKTNQQGIKERRCASIDTFDFKDLAGHLDVSGMTELEELIVSDNGIESINFGGNPKLWRINCSYNNLTELITDDLPELLVLICNNNAIEELDFSNNKNITFINADNNMLSSIGLAGLNKLNELYCSNNELTEINIKDLKNIVRLYLNNNYIEELDLTALTYLQIFSANNNLLRELDLSNCEDITNISVNSNELIYLDLTGLRNIARLDCANNKLDFNKIKIPARSFNSISYTLLYPQDTIGREKLHFYNNGYYSPTGLIDLSEYAYSSGDATYFQLYIIDENGNKTPSGLAVFDGIFNVTNIIEGKKIVIEASCSVFPNLILTTPVFVAKYEYDSNDVTKLRAFLNQYSKFGNEENGLTNGIILEDLTNVQYDSNLPETFPVVWQAIDGVYRLVRINWQYFPLLKGNLDLSNCSKLNIINISCDGNLNRNDITSLNLNNCVELQYLYASYSQLETLNINNCSALIGIDCAHNKIENNIIVSSESIKYIDLTDNKIENIVITAPQNVDHLFIGFNKLQTLNLNNFNSITELECNNNNLFELDINGITTLRYIDFANNKISEFNISNNPKLRILYCDNNLLNSLVLEDCIELSALTCSNNQLTELDLINIPYLYQLETGNNALTFRTLQYPVIPNEISLHPQAIVYPSDIEDYILRGDTLNLQEYFVENDTIVANIILRYVSSGDLVNNNLYKVEDNIITDFHSSLIDTSLFVEMTHSHYPGLILKTIHFNTKKPWRYNEEEVAALRHFFNQESKIEGLTNGQYLSSNNYNPDDPETFPAVYWIPIDPEFRVERIKWNNRTDLQGYANFNPMIYMDTLLIGGTYEYNTNIDSIIIDNCIALKDIQLQNNRLSKIRINNCKNLELINLSNNALTSLDITELENIRSLDVAHNALTFNTFHLISMPESIYWWPQKELVLSNLIRIYDSADFDYMLIDSTVYLTEFGSEIIYIWYDAEGNVINPVHYGDGEFIIPKELNNKIIYCILTATDELKLGLSLKTVNFFVDFYTSILENIDINFSVYPNPATSYATINIKDELLPEQLKINIIDIAGSIVKSFEQPNISHSITLNIDDINAGMYFIQIITENNKIILPFSIRR